MGTHQERTTVPFTSKDMFDLVADVEDYPRFIPWIEALRITDRREGARGEELTADMVVKFKMFRETFRSHVTLDREADKIDVRYVRGPLKTLSTVWRFEPAPQGCVVDFCVNFEFRNRLMQTVAMQLIDKAFKRLSGAFIAEAHRRYEPIIEKQRQVS